MPTFSLNISCTIIQVQGDSDINIIDRSQTTTNMDSFNVLTTTLTNQSSAPESPLESAHDSDVPLDDVSSLSAPVNTKSYQQSDSILQTGSEARSTLTSSSMSVELEDIYPSPSSRAFTQDQRAAEHNSNRSTDSLEAPDSESLNSPPPKKKLCQHVINKLNRLFHRFLRYL